MAKAKQGILGGFEGKIGNVVGVTRYGKTFMRSLPEHYNDRKSEAQLIHRKKITTVNDFLRPIKSFVKIGYRNLAVGKSAYNVAYSNMFKSNVIVGEYPNFAIDYSKCPLAVGDLRPALDPAVSYDNNQITISWTNNSDNPNANPDDIANILIFNTSNGESVCSTSSFTRSGQSFTANIPSTWSGNAMVVYLFFASANDKHVSNSQYLGEFTCQ